MKEKNEECSNSHCAKFQHRSFITSQSLIINFLFTIISLNNPNGSIPTKSRGSYRLRSPGLLRTNASTIDLSKPYLYKISGVKFTVKAPANGRTDGHAGMARCMVVYETDADWA